MDVFVIFIGAFALAYMCLRFVATMLSFVPDGQSSSDKLPPAPEKLMLSDTIEVPTEITRLTAPLKTLGSLLVVNGRPDVQSAVSGLVLKVECYFTGPFVIGDVEVFEGMLQDIVNTCERLRRATITERIIGDLDRQIIECRRHVIQRTVYRDVALTPAVAQIMRANCVPITPDNDQMAPYLDLCRLSLRLEKVIVTQTDVPTLTLLIQAQLLTNHVLEAAPGLLPTASELLAECFEVMPVLCDGDTSAANESKMDEGLRNHRIARYSLWAYSDALIELLS